MKAIPPPEEVPARIAVGALPVNAQAPFPKEGFFSFANVHCLGNSNMQKTCHKRKELKPLQFQIPVKIGGVGKKKGSGE